MKFFAYLIERDITYDVPRSSKIDMYQAKKLILERCSKSLKGTRIFRGSPNDADFLLTDPNQGERKSANTANYYTLMIDNFPAWKRFPKRSKSLVCTCNFGHAHGYGQPYVVFPSDKCKIGVCPSYDIWESKVPLLTKHGDVDFNDISYSIHVMLNKPPSPPFSKLPSMLEKIKDVATYGMATCAENLHDDINDWLEQHPDKKVIDYFEALLDPRKLYFGVAKPGDTLPPSNELWVGGGTCVLVKASGRFPLYPGHEVPNDVAQLFKELDINLKP